MYTENPHKQIKIDNHLQFAPAAMVFELDAFGIKAKHNLRDKTMLFLMWNIITNATVYSMKSVSLCINPLSFCIKFVKNNPQL